MANRSNENNLRAQHASQLFGRWENKLRQCRPIERHDQLEHGFRVPMDLAVTRNEENGNCGLAKDPVSHAPPQDSLARTTPMRRHDDEVSALGVDDLENRISRLGI